jgi:Ran GTPase-activating protein (RanGAP) involved in mRNA processing and transport
MTEADFSNKNLGPGGATIISAWISHRDNGALFIANVMGNSIGKEMLSKLQEIMHSKPNLVSLCGIANDATEADLSGLGMDADDAIILASELPNKRALSVLSLKDNRLLTAEAGKILSDMVATNTVLKELDLSSNGWKNSLGCLQGDGPGFAQELAVGIRDNGTLSKLVMRQNNYQGAESGKAFSDMLAQNTVLKELDLSTQKNSVLEYALDAAFVKEFAVGIKDNVALLSLHLANNSLYAEGTKLLAEVLKGNTIMTELNVSSNTMTYGGMSGVFALADAIPDMGALSMFTFSGDYSSSKPVTMETTMTEADFSGKELGVSGAMMVAAFLPKCQ